MALLWPQLFPLGECTAFGIGRLAHFAARRQSAFAFGLAAKWRPGAPYLRGGTNKNGALN